MIQFTKKERIEELRKQRAEISRQIQALENEAITIGNARIDSNGFSILCVNKNYARNEKSWRIVMPREKPNPETKQRVELTDEEMKSFILSLINDMSEVCKNL